MNTEHPAAAAPKVGIFSKPWAQSAVGVAAVMLVLVGFLFYRSFAGQVKIENSQIVAPISALGPTVADTLDAVYVKEGDMVAASAPLAKVGSEVITAKTAGIVVSVNDNIGSLFNRGQAVVSMIDPNEFRVIGEIEEDKGLASIRPGQPVSFTVDAFGGKEFVGIVDSVSPTSNESSIAFSISDKRPTKKFDVKARFDVAAHPEFKNGMSAKMTVFVK